MLMILDDKLDADFQFDLINEMDRLDFLAYEYETRKVIIDAVQKNHNIVSKDIDTLLRILSERVDNSLLMKYVDAAKAVIKKDNENLSTHIFEGLEELQQNNQLAAINVNEDMIRVIAHIQHISPSLYGISTDKNTDFALNAPLHTLTIDVFKSIPETAIKNKNTFVFEAIEDIKSFLQIDPSILQTFEHMLRLVELFQVPENLTRLLTVMKLQNGQFVTDLMYILASTRGDPIHDYLLNS